jgi:DHA1 family bicyclomycin/chloramphenicol resistance-like MFS transporter
MLAVGPALTPILGGVLLGAFGWHSIFVAMVAYGVVVVLLMWLVVPETNANQDPALAQPSGIVRSYSKLLRDRRFMRASLVLGLTLGGLFTMSALVPFVLMDTVGLTPTQFGLAMVAQTGAFTAGSVLTARLLRRMDALRLVPIGLLLVVAAGLGFGIGLRVFPASVLAVMGPASLWAFGIALLMPGTTTSALAGFAAIAGAASALTGFLQVGGGLAGSAVAALVFRDPFVALTVVMPSMAALAALVHWGLAVRKPNPSSGSR